MTVGMQMYFNSDNFAVMIADVVHGPRVLNAAKDEFVDSLAFFNICLHVANGLQVVKMRRDESK